MTVSYTHLGKPSRVIAIRHWSTPDYTRVAIDLEEGVKYESQRIDHPDRVFFDLLNTRLDPSLAGKTFDVSDGLLKAIRTSQFTAGRTRVVLDLDELSEFDASLQSNPPRLIIDVHNKPASGTPVVKESTSTTETAEDENSTNKIVPDSISASEEPTSLPKTAVDKPVRRNLSLIHIRCV